MKLSFKQRLFFYITIVFSLFTIGVIVFENHQEKKYKTEALEDKLNDYIQLINNRISNNENVNYKQIIDTLQYVFPQNLRITLIDLNGVVLYDNSVQQLSSFKNHLSRPEIIAAQKSANGNDIRTSATNHHEYLYYAQKAGDKYIRVALPYDIQVKNVLKSDNIFLYVILILYVIILFLINLVSNRFGSSIKQLHNLALNKTSLANAAYEFPEDELGEIGSQIAKNYLLLEDSKNKIALEKEKLLQHVHLSKEGICFFSNKKEVEFYNSLFLHYTNNITEETASNPIVFITDKVFESAHRFLLEPNSNYLEYTIEKQGKIFSIRVILFENKSFEVILNDITQQEKNRILKQEITGNIAHELRTPVASISGYLETILEQSLTKEQQDYFISKAFKQTQNLSGLIQDISLIAKMEETGFVFKKEAINLHHLIQQLKEDYDLLLKDNPREIQINLPEEIVVNGNYNLLQSIFKNLIDNSLRYAGEDAKIALELYKEDSDFYYFSFYDTGKGISDESHLSHLFERFYRVSEGRTRDTGGTGLGLSIVKNAIAFHGGTITAKNKKGGGLEFLFELKK